MPIGSKPVFGSPPPKIDRAKAGSREAAVKEGEARAKVTVEKKYLNPKMVAFEKHYTCVDCARSLRKACWGHPRGGEVPLDLPSAATLWSARCTACYQDYIARLRVEAQGTARRTFNPRSDPLPRKSITVAVCRCVDCGVPVRSCSQDPDTSLPLAMTGPLAGPRMVPLHLPGGPSARCLRCPLCFGQYMRRMRHAWRAEQASGETP